MVLEVCDPVDFLILVCPERLELLLQLLLLLLVNLLIGQLVMCELGSRRLRLASRLNMRETRRADHLAWLIRHRAVGQLTCGRNNPNRWGLTVSLLIHLDSSTTSFTCKLEAVEKGREAGKKIARKGKYVREAFGSDTMFFSCVVNGKCVAERLKGKAFSQERSGAVHTGKI